MPEGLQDYANELACLESTATVDHDAGVVSVDSSGVIEASRAKAGLRAARRLANELGYALLFDVSDAKVALSIADTYFLPRDPEIPRTASGTVAVVHGAADPAEWAKFAELTAANAGIVVQLYENRDEALAELRKTQEALRATGAPRGDARILVVDDDPDILASSSRVIRNAGYEVFEAGTGEEALEVALREKPDLVLLDVVLPGIDGIEVCRRLREEPSLKGSIVALASSIRTTIDDQHESLGSSPDAYLSRPLGNKDLIASIEFLLRKNAWSDIEPT